MQMREKVGKSRNTVFFHVFPMICGSRGSKSSLAKAAGAEPSGQMRDEQLHAVVARSTFASQNAQNTPGSDHFWKFRCWKSARRCGAKHISKSKCTKHTSYGPLLEVEMSKKCTPLWREAHDVQMCFRVAGARDCAPCQKWAKREGFVACPKAMAGVGHLKRIFKDAFRVAGAVQETCSSEMLGGQGADFLRGFAFWSIRSSGLLRWFCMTGAALRMTWHHFFVVGAVVQNSLDRWTGKIAKLIGTKLLALHSTFHFWRKARRIALFLMLSTLKNEEVSQNCFVFDVVNFKKWEGLAELLRFWCCQLQQMRKSRRSAAFLMLSTWKWRSLVE